MNRRLSRFALCRSVHVFAAAYCSQRAKRQCLTGSSRALARILHRLLA
jgi:hypothetical protein